MQLLKDPRDYQIIFLSLFLTVGIIYRDWTLNLEYISIILLVCCSSQIILHFIAKIPNFQFSSGFNLADFLLIPNLKSAVITGLGLSLLLRSNNLSTLILAGLLAIASKFILTHHNKHWFNPANFGIICALLFTNDAWISPGQWGSDSWYFLLFITTGAMILQKVGRWETTAIFLLTYGSLESIYNYYLGWNFAVLLHQLMSGSLLIFACFMLTDPRSIPNSKKARIIWSIAIAIVSFIFKELFYLNTAVFWALFFISPATIFLDYWWQGSRFRWQNSLSKS